MRTVTTKKQKVREFLIAEMLLGGKPYTFTRDELAQKFDTGEKTVGDAVQELANDGWEIEQVHRRPLGERPLKPAELTIYPREDVYDWIGLTLDTRQQLEYT